MKTLAKWITTAILSIASMQAIAFNSEIFPKMVSSTLKRGSGHVRNQIWRSLYLTNTTMI